MAERCEAPASRSSGGAFPAVEGPRHRVTTAPNAVSLKKQPPSVSGTCLVCNCPRAGFSNEPRRGPLSSGRRPVFRGGVGLGGL